MMFESIGQSFDEENIFVETTTSLYEQL